MNDVAESAEHRVFADPNTLAREVAEWLCGLAQAAVGEFAICLSGGSTPRLLYERLADPSVASRFPWQRVHWFWGDERFVPKNDPRSNYRMVYEALLAKAPIDAARVHAIPTENISPEQSAADYENVLKRFYGGENLDSRRPIFDVNLLGIGENGHTASLFPGDPALDEERRWAVAVRDEAAETRITLTYPALNSSRDAAFLATGESKRQVVARARAGDRRIPAGRIRPVGRLHWFTDRSAAEGGA
ncbi:MAG TPA: 6-phosphogluconolactonase [Xanthobacteraceae bacterium]|jgi:6-phosphogluconolactonase